MRTAPIQLDFPLIPEILVNHLPQEVAIRLSCMETCETSQKAKSNYEERNKWKKQRGRRRNKGDRGTKGSGLFG